MNYYWILTKLNYWRTAIKLKKLLISLFGITVISNSYGFNVLNVDNKTSVGSIYTDVRVYNNVMNDKFLEERYLRDIAYIMNTNESDDKLVSEDDLKILNEKYKVKDIKNLLYRKLYYSSSEFTGEERKFLYIYITAMSEKSKNFLKTAKETDYFEKAFSKAIVFKADKDLISSLKKKFNSQENGEFVVLNKNDVKKLCSDDKKFDTLSSLLSKNPKMELDKTNNTLSTSINNCLKNRD